MEKIYEGVEQRFTRCYQKYGERSVMVLLGFYKGQYHKFFLSTLFFVVKHAPALFSSLLIANVINGVVAGGRRGNGRSFLTLAFGFFFSAFIFRPTGSTIGIRAG